MQNGKLLYEMQSNVETKRQNAWMAGIVLIALSSSLFILSLLMPVSVDVQKMFKIGSVAVFVMGISAIITTRIHTAPAVRRLVCFACFLLCCLQRQFAPLTLPFSLATMDKAYNNKGNGLWSRKQLPLSGLD